MHPHIERYLTQVEKRLKSLSTEQRSEELRELGQHLQALVEERQENGQSEAEAVKAAMRQFGEPGRVGRDLNEGVRLHVQPYRLPLSLSITSFIIAVHPVVALLLFLASFLQSRGLWDAEVNAYGIGFFYWNLGRSLLNCSLTLAAVYLFRRLRPWAFWMALIITTSHTLLGFVAFLGTIDSLKAHLPNVGVLKWLALGICLTLCLYYFLMPLFCLLALISNRTTYFHLSRAKWRTSS